MCEKYQGYTNWQTATVSMVLSNLDETVYKETRGAARRGPRALKEYVEEFVSDVQGVNMLVDQLTSWALEDVNWSELVAHFTEIVEGKSVRPGLIWNRRK